VTLADVLDAAKVIDGHVVRTPCLHARTISSLAHAEVYLKFENLQFTASFKERGALVKLASLDAEERARGVIAASAGNHAQGVAHHAQRLGIPAVIVMPRHTPQTKVERTQYFGAQIVLHGEGFDEARARATAIAAERRLVWVDPYDDPRVVAGQGTAALEMLAEHPALDTIVVPVGGGGLLAGTAVATKGVRPDVRVIGVQSDLFPALACAWRGDPVVSAAAGAGPTIADGIAVRSPGRLPLAIARATVDDMLLVDDGALEEAIVMLAEIEKTVVEGAGAAALAAVLGHRDRFEGRRVGVVLSGGNIDTRVLAAVLERGLVRSGRLARLRFRLRDVPGALAAVTATLAQVDANVESIVHQRVFHDGPAQIAEVEVVLRTRGHAHVAAIVRALADSDVAAVIVRPREV
jgi:threonine dehydratase